MKAHFRKIFSAKQYIVFKFLLIFHLFAEKPPCTN